MVKGKVYSFKYTGGTNPNAVRHVYIDNINTPSVGGYDLDKGAYRNFTVSKIVNVREDLSAKVLDVTMLPPGIGANNIIGSFRSNGYHVDSYGELVIAYKPVLTNYSIGLTNTVFNGPGGKLVIDNMNNLVTFNGVRIVIDNTKPQELVNYILKVIN